MGSKTKKDDVQDFLQRSSFNNTSLVVQIVKLKKT